jgi:hypothetical protein
MNNVKAGSHAPGFYGQDFTYKECMAHLRLTKDAQQQKTLTTPLNFFISARYLSISRSQ